jgi:hypothetical protein
MRSLLQFRELPGDILFEAGKSSSCSSVANGIERHEPGTRKRCIQAEKPIVNASGPYVVVPLRGPSGHISDLTSKRMSPLTARKLRDTTNIFKRAVWATARKGLITLLGKSVNMRGAAYLELAQGFSF